MRTSKPVKPPASLWVVILLATLLPLLAVFQYNWLGQLSESEQGRMQANLRAATFRFAQEFDGDLAHIYKSFQVDYSEQGTASEQLALQYAEWVNDFQLPDLIQDIYWIHNDHDSGLTIRQFNGTDDLIEVEDWPDDLADLKEAFRRCLKASAEQHDELLGPPPLQAEIPALVIQQLFMIPRSSLGDRPSVNWVVVRFDRGVLTKELLPRLASEYFSSEDVLEFNVAILKSDDPETIIYASDPNLSAALLSSPDAERAIFRLHPFEFPQRSWKNRRTWRVIGDHNEPRWRLVVKHRAGSLEAAVAAVRHRNLFISFSVLLLLGGSVLLIVVSARRAQRLALQQMEFVAGISHELRTPLAVICSAGENLADEVIHDPGKTRKYGRVINREGRRLTEMVERVLLFSRIQSGHQSYELHPLSVASVIDDALESSRALIAEKGVRVKADIAKNLPTIMADERALKSAIQNLLNNAIKYSMKEGLIRIGAREATGSGEPQIQIAVEDHAGGIPASELAHVFEPFYRGKKARQEQTEGSGLGLSLVKQVMEAHGGKVTVRSTPGEGSTFLLHLPAGDSPSGRVERD
ncbi:MAG: sensor histidine kinase [Acidobacteriota bacterium]